MTTLFNDSQIKGMTTELLCAIKFLELGYTVSIPYGNTSRYDMLVDLGSRFLRIQCKTAKRKDNGSYVVNTCNSATSFSKRVIKYYDSSQIDFIATIIEDFLLLIPVDQIDKSKSKIFRSSLPKNGTKSTCNLIQDYMVERILI